MPITSICPVDSSSEFTNESPLWTNGWTFHQLGLVIALGFGGFATIVSLILVFLHGIHYSNPTEQKHIIRILMMIPVYAVISFLSFYYYNHAVYWQTVRDCYEAFAIASFFTLLCHYIAPNLHEQKNYFRTITPKNWFWGVFGLQYILCGQRGPLRKPRSGLTWFNVVWIGIFQYCFVRVACTIEALVTELVGHYCEHSFNPKYGHFWYQALTAISVTVAMFCIIQFYIQTKDDLREHKPFLKVLCIKLVIFFSFWQTLVISALASSYGPLKPSAKLNAPDIFIGIPSVLIDFEMAFFAIMHIFAFSWRPYSLKNQHMISAPGSIVELSPPRYRGGFLGIMAYLDAMNPWDIIKAIARGFRWLFVGYRHRDADHAKYVDPNKDHEYMTTETPMKRPTDGGITMTPVHHASFEDDRQGLLHSPSATSFPQPGASPYQQARVQPHPPAVESEFDLSNPSAYRPASSRVHDPQDTTYQPSHQQQPMHPGYRSEPSQQHDPNWNVFGGTQQDHSTQQYAYGGHTSNYPNRI